MQTKPRKYTGDKAERQRQAVNAFYQRNKDSEGKKKRLNKYGLSEREYNDLIKTHGGICAICSEPYPLMIDHDHKSGKVRGLICRRCNTGLGYFKDSTENLENAIKYLLKN